MSDVQEGAGEGGCRVRSNASWVMVICRTPRTDIQTYTRERHYLATTSLTGGNTKNHSSEYFPVGRMLIQNSGRKFFLMARAAYTLTKTYYFVLISISFKAT